MTKIDIMKKIEIYRINKKTVIAATIDGNKQFESKRFYWAFQAPGFDRREGDEITEEDLNYFKEIVDD